MILLTIIVVYFLLFLSMLNLAALIRLLLARKGYKKALSIHGVHIANNLSLNTLARLGKSCYGL